MDETKVITGKVRASYAHVFEPTENKNGDLKYSICLLIDKEDNATLGKIEMAIEAAKKKGVLKWGGKIPKKLKVPLRDGDEDREDSPEYSGMMFLNASSNSRPGIIDRQKRKILQDPGNEIFEENASDEEFYSGCYCRAAIKFYPYSTNGSNGIAVGLENLQKLGDGKRFSGGSSAAEDFAEDFAEDLPY